MQRIIINPVIKDTTIFVKTAAETGGRHTQVEVRLMPGGGTPLHYHKSFSETFTVLEGVLGLQLGYRKKILLPPGKSHTVEAGQAHRFFNSTGKKIRFSVDIRPGHTGFENGLYIMYGLAGDGMTNKKGVPKKIQHLALVAEMSEMYLPGIFTLFKPVFKRIAKKARENGTEQMLIEKYCRLYI